MTVKLVREGNRYRIEPEINVLEMPDELIAESLNRSEFPSKVELWGPCFNPEAAAKLLEISDKLEIHGDKK